MNILNILNSWFNDYLSDEEAVYFLFLIIFSVAVFFLFGQMLAPVFSSVVIAYLLQGAVLQLVKRGLSDFSAVLLVYTLTFGFFFAFMVLVFPMVWQQLTELLDSQLPKVISDTSEWLEVLPVKYPDLISATQAQQWIDRISLEVASGAQIVLSFSLSKLPNVIALLVYLVLVPVMVFFFLKDREKMARWAKSFLPAKRTLLKSVWLEMDDQISNYVRGKAIEILIVGAVTFVCFWLVDVKYAALLSLLVGMSVVVPYVGAVVVTVPVALAGYFQFGLGGWDSPLVTMLLLYTVIQALDGNVLVPILFSEAVNLHPVAIIIAILIFGGLWGFLGVFFAIPLATLVKAVLSAWPKGLQREDEADVDDAFDDHVYDH
ncbi:MAG: AI-2E family transporter [Gammaproteobacteria bacterium]|nr:AI-2E family transporter [Gammaproteobacteria bacterium]